MPHRKKSELPTIANPAAPAPPSPPAGEEARTGSRLLSDEQLGRWAEIIAAGEEPLPQDLEPSQASALTHRVRQLRRQRLVGFIARQVALEVHRARSAAAKNEPSPKNAGR
jgi:hypothetical protein